MVERFDDYVLGETGEPVALETSGENRIASVVMAGQARRKLMIVSRDLDPAIYDNPEFVDAVNSMVFKTQHARIRILVMELEPMARAGHRLIEAAQRLSSFIEVRMPALEHQNFNQALLIADETGVIHRQLSDRFEATANFNDPVTVTELMQQFEPMWEHATLDPNVNRLHL